MRIGRALIIPAVLALSVAGSALVGSALPAVAGTSVYHHARQSGLTASTRVYHHAHNSAFTISYRVYHH